jgi:hypothetical protein
MRALGIILLTIIAPVSLLSKNKMQTAGDSVSDSPSEIILERIFEGCINCPDRKVVLERAGAKKYEEATVTETDLHTKKQRRGKLRPYFYNQLLRLVEAQGYYQMQDQYAMGWADSTIVTLSVTLGVKRKVIQTRSEGNVPIQLWGIYYAIDGALANVKWESSQ